MAAIGKIRSWSTFLVIVIAVGLFAFIVEDAFRSCDSSKNNERQVVGKIYGEKINVQDFQKLVDEYTDVIKMQQGTDNLNEDQLNQVKDMVWNTFVQNRMISKEAEALGLQVTDEELQNILKEGTNPMLMQTPFVNQQTGRFDVNALKKFLNDYNAQKNGNGQQAEQYQKIYNYWSFIEKTLRDQTLAQKYQSLFAHCLLSNPVEAKMAFKEENEESKVQLAAFPYSSIQDSKVQITSSDMEAKYKELKPRFRQIVESRDIKFVSVQVVASAADRKALDKQFADYDKQLAAAADPSELIQKSGSQVPYLGVAAPKEFYPQDIAQLLDSVAVGSTTAVKENKYDNSLNIVKLIAKVEAPDSVQYRMISVPKTAADSVMGAIQGGADFEAVAKKYQQEGAAQWITAQQLIGSLVQSNNADQRKMVQALQNGAVNSLQNIALAQGNVILQVKDRKAMKTQYQAAVIKKPIEFSQDTYRAAYNKFSSFVSANKDAQSIIKNAQKNGYKVQDLPGLTTSVHYVANIRSTREALKWIFDADENDVSPLYECGNNDNLLIVILDKINHVGYADLKNPQVNSYVKAEVLKDKKAEMLMQKLNGVKSIAAAKAKGGNVSTVDQITFAAPVFIAAVGASEPALSGAVAATAQGKFSATPVKGQAGVYVFQVASKKMRPGKFDDKTMEQKLRQQYMQQAMQVMAQELYQKAKVVDNRYLFF